MADTPDPPASPPLTVEEIALKLAPRLYLEVGPEQRALELQILKALRAAESRGRHKGLETLAKATRKVLDPESLKSLIEALQKGHARAEQESQ